MSELSPGPSLHGIAARLELARRRLQRLTPREAVAAVDDGALIVDTRPERQRRAEGEVPGALVLERNVLEWRLDPSSEAAIPQAAQDLHVIVLCSEGYSSSLAAASLQNLGITRATDVIGGAQAWRAARLPMTTGGTPTGSRSPAVPVTRAPSEAVTSA